MSTKTTIRNDTTSPMVVGGITVAPGCSVGAEFCGRCGATITNIGHHHGDIVCGTIDDPHEVYDAVSDTLVQWEVRAS